MKRAFRVKKHEDFDFIIKNGVKIKSKNFNLYFVKAPKEQFYTRIGLAVGKSNGHAVTRVREKRQVRAMISKRNDYSLPLDIIISIRPCYKESEFESNERELNSLLDTIKEKYN